MDEIIEGIRSRDPDNKLFSICKGAGYPAKVWVEDESGNVIVHSDDVLTLGQAVRLLNSLGIEVKL